MVDKVLKNGNKSRKKLKQCFQFDFVCLGFNMDMKFLVNVVAFALLVAQVRY